MSKVSLWIGNLEHKEKLDKFVKEIYSEHGDSSSSFMNAFEIDFIDNQFQEVYFYESETSKNEIFDSFSYIDSFFEEIPEMNWSESNCVILLYNFDYDKKVEQKDDIKYIGSFSYKED